VGLERYNQKRDFNKTAEPEGKVAPKHKQLIFVVQKHNASRLHYDFRLEMEGVLKSWAVPKGPSLNPQDKRLAVMVEDHPYSYKDFEGSIPKGEYGGGDVIVWDNGTYEPADQPNAGQSAEQALLEDLERGRLSIALHGSKLKGQFSLVQMKGRGENNWLLAKKDDKYATDSDVLKKNKSVISKYTVENISDSGVIYGQKATAKKASTKAAAKASSAKKSPGKKASVKSATAKTSPSKKASGKTSTKASSKGIAKRSTRKSASR